MKNHDRITALLTERATQGLTLDESRELGQLAAMDPSLDLDSIDEAAAALTLALVNSEMPEMPSDLHAKLQRDAEAFWEPSAPIAPKPSPTPVLAWVGWVAAAAAVLFALVLLQDDGQAVLQAEQVAQVSDAVEIAWTGTEDPLGQGVGGEVLWSDDEQRGFMRFEGLEPNDPQQQQYQLWIFDKDRSADHPVDGGVFDVPAGSDSVLVPIDAKLAVSEATLFAITLEKPGGVVVSSRERLLLTAAVP